MYEEANMYSRAKYTYVVRSYVKAKTSLPYCIVYIYAKEGKSRFDADTCEQSTKILSRNVLPLID